MIAFTITQSQSGAGAIYTRANLAVLEAIGAVRVIQAYNLQGVIGERYGALLATAGSANIRKALVTGGALGYSQYSMFGLYALAIRFGGAQELAKCRSSFGAFLKAQTGFPDIAKCRTRSTACLPRARAWWWRTG